MCGMNILGLNGVYPRSHDASAALVTQNGLEAFAEEERFVRAKRAFDQQPIHSQAYCLNNASLSVNELEGIAYGWQGKQQYTARELLPTQLGARLEKHVPVTQVEHHEAHAASVFYTSPFQEAAVLVVDGQGEHESTTIWRANKDGLEKVQSYDVSESLGYMYGAVSKFCGLGSFGGGKLMGLAPYGEPIYVDQIAAAYYAISLPEQVKHDSQDAYFERFHALLGRYGFVPAQEHDIFNEYSARLNTEPRLMRQHRDLAASAQAFLEQKMLELAAEAQRLTGSSYLCMAGGVAMNCATNSLIQNSGLFKEVYLQPACEDSGVALGAALAIRKEHIGLPTVYTGPAFSDASIGVLLERYGINARREEDVAQKVAELLASNRIIGWFNGGLECGPRALGGRSILANPADSLTRDRVNHVKSREQWRPFGPSVLAEEADQLFEAAHESRFMLRSFQVRSEWKTRLAAVTHIDGSTRPQTVTPEDNPSYYAAIQAFFKLTGLPGVLNTSFNNHDEPIVATPTDAIKTFYSTGLDALVLGNHIIYK